MAKIFTLNIAKATTEELESAVRSAKVVMGRLDKIMTETGEGQMVLIAEQNNNPKNPFIFKGQSLWLIPMKEQIVGLELGKAALVEATGHVIRKGHASIVEIRSCHIIETDEKALKAYEQYVLAENRLAQVNAEIQHRAEEAEKAEKQAKMAAQLRDFEAHVATTGGDNMSDFLKAPLAISWEHPVFLPDGSLYQGTYIPSFQVASDELLAQWNLVSIDMLALINSRVHEYKNNPDAMVQIGLMRRHLNYVMSRVKDEGHKRITLAKIGRKAPKPVLEERRTGVKNRTRRKAENSSESDLMFEMRLLGLTSRSGSGSNTKSEDEVTLFEQEKEAKRQKQAAQKAKKAQRRVESKARRLKNAQDLGLAANE